MSTDLNTTRSSILRENSLPSAKSVKGNRSEINFAEIIQKSGKRLENGLNALSDRAGITSISEHNDKTSVIDDNQFDRNDNRNDTATSRANDDGQTNRGRENDNPDNSDRTDYDVKSTHSQNNESENNSNDEFSRGGRNEHHNENSQFDNRPDDENNISTDANGNKRSNETTETSASNQNTSKGEQAHKNDNSANNSGSANKAGATATTEMLNNLLNNAKENSLLSQVSNQSQNFSQSSAGNNAIAKGENEISNFILKETESRISEFSQSGTNAKNNQSTKQNHDLFNNQGQVLNKKAGDSDILSTATQSKNFTKTIDQASQLSKIIGAGNKVDISVKVTDEKSNLFSKPTANLSASALLTTDTTKATLRSQQGASTTYSNSGNQAQQAAGLAVGAAGQLQQATQQQVNTQGQLSGSTASSTKSANQLNPQIISTQGSLSSNGDTPAVASPNSVSTAQQAQQSTSAQAVNSTRFTTANSAVVDQITIQISKALNAGNDKISIQLKPADLGRVDIKMEVGHDGRVVAIVTADNKQTLDLLQKDSKELQEALMQAGLKTDDDSLSFNLREKNDGEEMQMSEGNGNNKREEDELTLEEELAGVRKNIITDTRVDVQA